MTRERRNEPPEPPYLLTPGPLTTSIETRRAMLRDWGSRERDFIELTAKVCDRLLAMAGASNSHVCIPLQGSGTFAVEAALGTLVGSPGKVLVLINGAYGRRIARILEIIGRAHSALEWAEDEPPDIARLEAELEHDPAVSHVALVHCETTSGILNPLEDIARLVAAKGRSLLVDAMSSFGALDIDASSAEAVIASANKCLEGAPGMSFVIARKEALEHCRGNAHSLSLDLYDQWKAMEANGQWRFTPPTHVVAALAQALERHEAEGGAAGRHVRYRENCRTLVEGMRDLGFETLLDDAHQAPIIVTFRAPRDARFDFDRFYAALHRRGYAIYPGKLAAAPSFRIGCIGEVGVREMEGVVEAVREALHELGVKDPKP